MRKIFAFLLILALLVPVLPITNAAKVETKPFYGLSWAAVDNKANPYMNGLVTLRISVLGDSVTMSYGGASIHGNDIDDAQVEKFAAVLKKDMSARPEGMRYIHFFGPSNAYDIAPKNVIYLDYGVDQLAKINDAIFAKYKEIGGQVDGAIMSCLYTSMGSYYINSSNAKKDPLIYNKIVKDPRYATEVRPLLAERGFTFYDKPTDHTPEIYGITGNAGSQYSNCAAIWDTVMRNRLSAYITEWAYTPMAKYFPDVHVSDYQTVDNDTWFKSINDKGSTIGSGGHSEKAGNTSCQNFYANRPNDEFYKTNGQPVYKKPVTFHQAVFEETSYNAFMYDMNVAKQVYNSTDNQEVCYWVSRYGGGTVVDNNTSITGTPYYAEQAYHLCMYDPKPFVIFLAREQFDSQEHFDNCVKVANELMAEVTRVAGYADRKPIATPTNWNSEFVLSGMYANGRNIWRITPNRDLTTKEAFKVEGKDPTFSIGGQTVTFPGGKIIEDTAVSFIGTVGYWVETAKDVTPVITTDADRFAKLPSYVEDFESYETGTKLLAMNVRDAGGWVVQPKGTDLLITADGENKVLSMGGNSLLQNKLIPANVTLADNYAPEQLWSVNVTVPEGFSGEAVLLSYEGSKQPTEDGGFKLAGTKLYYSENGEYKELMDIAAGKYQLQRTLDFHTGGAYTCDYTVTDAAGTQLKSVQDVAVPSFVDKVSAIGFSCTNVTTPLLLDNYTLRAVGAAADLTLYETAFGMKLTTDTANVSTTYRLSWANASGKEETAAVKADIYEGETLKETKTLKELTLTPGCDGVEIGTVDVAEGQSVKVYLSTALTPVTPFDPDEVPAPSEPAPDGTVPAPSETAPAESEKGGSNTALIVVIAVVAVAAVAAVVLVLLKKKPAKKTEE